MRWIVTALALAMSAGSAVAECPAGAYPWVDRRGVEVCKRDMIGPREPGVGGEACTAGTVVATDRWGGQTCRRLNSARGRDGGQR